MRSRTNWARTIVRAAIAIAVSAPACVALAQTSEATGGGRDLATFGAHVLYGTIDTEVFGVLGIGQRLAGYRAYAWAVPWNVNKELEADHNTAVAIVVGALFLGISIIIAAVLLS